MSVKIAVQVHIPPIGAQICGVSDLVTLKIVSQDDVFGSVEGNPYTISVVSDSVVLNFAIVGIDQDSVPSVLDDLVIPDEVIV